MHALDRLRDEEAAHVVAVVAVIEARGSAAAGLRVHAPGLRRLRDAPAVIEAAGRRLDAHRDGLADGPVLHQLARLHVRWVVHEVLEHAQPPAGVDRGFVYQLQIAECQRRRLLQRDVLARLQRLDCDLLVKMMWQEDLDRVDIRDRAAVARSRGRPSSLPTPLVAAAPARRRCRTPPSVRRVDDRGSRALGGWRCARSR